MAMIKLPTRSEAEQYALMVQTGLPGVDAVSYFLEADTPLEVLREASAIWQKHAYVREAQVALNKGEWSALAPEDRIKLALEKHYAEMAYYLMTSNYGDLDGQRKTKADSCRVALEQKLAGYAGKMDALSRFYTEMLAKNPADKPAPKKSAVN